MLEDTTLREVFHIRVSLIGAIGVIALSFLLFIVLMSLLIMYTPVRNILPGYSASLRQQLVQETARVDSLQADLTLQRRYLDIIKQLTAGDIETDSVQSLDSVQRVERAQILEQLRNDATADFQAQYEQKERDRLSLYDNMSNRAIPQFYRPVRGAVVQPANPEENRYAVAVRSAKNEPVLSVMRGNIVMVERAEDNTFTATAESTSSRVVLEFNVCFSATNDADVDGTAQAAIKLGEVESAATFMVLEPNSTWTPVFNADITPDPAEPYKVVLTIDYGVGKYGVTIGDYVLTNASGSASFQLAASKTSVQTIDFAGSGTLTSMKGDQVEGYMVKDNAGHWYATIQDATQAYNSSNGPYTVLHDGTPPDGWKIDEATKALIKLAKGFFFMAY